MINASSPLRFPQDLLRFLYWVYFRPFSLRQYLERFNLPSNLASGLFTRSQQAQPGRTSLTRLAAFYIWLVPWLLGLGQGSLLAALGIRVNWLSLTFYLLLGILLSLMFSLGFCIAFLLPFSLAVPTVSSSGFTSFHVILFSFLLGLAYSLTLKPAVWGLAGGITYGTVFAFLIEPIGGLAIGTAFLVGYFRFFLYVVEAPLTWTLAVLSNKGNAEKWWRFNPVTWDELIWFPLPALDRQLLALAYQNPALAREALAQVKESFRQGWAAKRVTAQE